MKGIIKTMSPFLLIIAFAVNCDSNNPGPKPPVRPITTHSVGGSVSGLNGSVVLKLNHGNDLTITDDGSFTFSNELDVNSVYFVTIGMQPSGQVCSVGSGYGSVTTTDVSNVVITCASGSGFTLSGRFTYDYVLAKDNVTEGGVKLDYSAKTTRPGRRLVVEAIQSSSAIGTAAIATALTNDLGNYTLLVPTGKNVFVRVSSLVVDGSNATDATSPNTCSGASYDIRVVDNTNSKAQYAMQSVSSYTTTTNSVNLHAKLTIDSGTSTDNITGAISRTYTYADRTAAPFALIDSIVTALELVCQGNASQSFPLLYVNWSTKNINVGGSKTAGQISTSHYTSEKGIGNLYILGAEGVDTDEFDDHVVAHEFGHYLENKIFRSDSIGGPHGARDVLDPRVAFGEGYGNAISAMTFNDAIYVDTTGPNQEGGFSLNVSTAPAVDQQTIYNEGAMQYFLWQLYENRDISSTNSGSFDRIYNIMANYQKTTHALTTGQYFASYYNQVYGGRAERLSTLWEGSSHLHGNFASLCSGSCSGLGDLADPFDLDNDLGIRYGGKNYAGTGIQDANFWRLYKEIFSGTSTVDKHDQLLGVDFGSGGTSFFPSNKMGYQRYYRYVATSNGKITISVTNTRLGCNRNYLDMYIYNRGNRIGVDNSSSGCPSVTFFATSGATYVVNLRGFPNLFSTGSPLNLSDYTISVTPST